MEWLDTEIWQFKIRNQVLLFDSEIIHCLNRVFGVTVNALPLGISTLSLEEFPRVGFFTFSDVAFM